MMKRSAQKGFTLIELAIVIAIISVLAAVAIPRFADLGQTAEAALAQDMVSQLSSGAAIYTARQGTPPTGFTQYVTLTNADLNAAPAGGNYFTVSLANFGPNAKNGTRCTIAAAVVTCNAAFNRNNVAYNFNNGAVTATVTPR
jgi:type IV pilus assembly protein PilA